MNEGRRPRSATLRRSVTPVEQLVNEATNARPLSTLRQTLVPQQQWEPRTQYSRINSRGVSSDFTSNLSRGRFRGTVGRAFVNMFSSTSGGGPLLQFRAEVRLLV